MNSLYASVTNTTDILGIVTTSNHDSPVASATVEAYTTSLSLGYEVQIDLGYTDNHALIITGYVKQIERNIPENIYSITIMDKMVRAQDYFIASINPQAPLSKKNITAEALITSLMGLAGLSVSANTTFFTFGVYNPFEINLVSVHDYCRMISELLTWSFWCDENGVVQFRNRKPYVMINQFPENVQPGFIADSGIVSYTLSPSTYLSSSYVKSEKNLRNRVVVYGSENVFAEASAASIHLPAGFFKSSVLAAPQLVDSNALALDIANYNLNLLNRITEQVSVAIIGNPSLKARTVIAVDDARMGLYGNWYCYAVDHQFSQQGYMCSVDLRRSLAP